MYSDSEGEDNAMILSSDEGEIDHVSVEEESETSSDNEISGTCEDNTVFFSKNGREIWERSPVAARGRQESQNIMRSRAGPTTYAIQRVDTIDSSLELFIRL